MKQIFILPARRERGHVLIGTLFLILVASILLIGVGSLSVAHQQRALVDSRYATALHLAEAGVNYELRKITANASNADQSPGVTYSFGEGTFRVYCADRDASNNASTPFTGGSKAYVYATGTVGGIARTVRVAARRGSSAAEYAIFAVNAGTFNGSAMSVNGNIGTNGTYSFSGSPGVTGTVSFNGPGSGWAGSPPSGYTVNYNPDPVVWPTVNELANQAFPSGGLTWLATNNDNNLCSGIVSNKIIANGNTTVTLVGKPGGANYYLTQMTFNGNAKIAFNNTNGPINIWVGPSGSLTASSISGGVASVKQSDDPEKGVRIYVATQAGFTISGNSRLDAGIYAYNTHNGSTIGSVTNNGNPQIYGSIISKNVTLNGNPTINYVSGMFGGSGSSLYEFDGLWSEINGR